MDRGEQRIVEICSDISPWATGQPAFSHEDGKLTIESDGYQRKTSKTAKELVEYDIVGPDPGNEGKHGEALPKNGRDPRVKSQ